MAVQERIEQIFHDVLNIDVPSPTTDVVAGGLLDSLGVVTLLFEIEHEFGVTIPLEHVDLDSLRTVNSIAEIVLETSPTATPGAGGPGPDRVATLLLRPGTEGRPLFFVHALGGDVMHLRPLIGAIDTNRPVYGVQARALDPRQEPQRRVEEMAETYARAIRSIQPNGPFTLAGFSFGGLVAFEMARVLTASGEKVASLLLIDTTAHHGALPRLARGRFLIKRPFRYLRYTLKAPRTRVPRYLRKAALRLFPRLPIAPPPREFDLPPQLEPFAAICDEAVAAYRPRGYDGAMTLTLADHPFPGEADPVEVWTPRARGGLTVVQFAGSHEDMVTNAGPLARFLSELLANEP